MSSLNFTAITRCASTALKLENDRYFLSTLVSLIVALISLYGLRINPWKALCHFISEFCLPSVYLDEENELFGIFLEWFSAHHHPKRALEARVTYPIEEGEIEGKLQYRPYFGTFRAIHNCRPFVLDRFYGDSRATYYGKNHKKEVIRIRGIALSQVKALIAEAFSWAKSQNSNKLISVYSPVQPQGSWKIFVKKLVRPMETVTLEETLKDRIIEDMKEHRNSRAWYEENAIPYRRGYLFSGPPGSGKSSFSFALASYFQMDVYIIHLSDLDLTDTNLAQLFTSLPLSCIVLLEDIDTISLSQKCYQNQDYERGITIGGLLNVIDGVTAHEGHVLIMTTNRPETLNEALTRPGRVDVHIRFPYISKESSRKMFVRLYQDSGRLVDSTLKQHSQKFAESIPDKKISSANVQNFLVRYKNSPRLAASKASEWVETIVKEE